MGAEGPSRRVEGLTPLQQYSRDLNQKELHEWQQAREFVTQFIRTLGAAGIRAASIGEMTDTAEELTGAGATKQYLIKEAARQFADQRMMIQRGPGSMKVEILDDFVSEQPELNPEVDLLRVQAALEEISVNETPRMVRYNGSFYIVKPVVPYPKRQNLDDSIENLKAINQTDEQLPDKDRG